MLNELHSKYSRVFEGIVEMKWGTSCSNPQMQVSSHRLVDAIQRNVQFPKYLKSSNANDNCAKNKIKLMNHSGIDKLWVD